MTELARTSVREKDQAILADWAGSAWQTESTLHQLSPYIGKAKSSMAASLVRQYAQPGEVVYDPFSGCGTFALEAWVHGCEVFANDLSPYASILTRAKLFPYRSLNAALDDFAELRSEIGDVRKAVDLRKVPLWVRRFFHPETLREAIAWTLLLRAKRKDFLLACLMGILHHQRPGFLSFPSSHTVPYLRVRKFPAEKFPDLYEYRSVEERLQAKIVRAFRRMPSIDFSLPRQTYTQSADRLVPRKKVDLLLSSPPYMRQLDYGRDNRLRLWFLGSHDWRDLDRRVSPAEDEFLRLMQRCFQRWRQVLADSAHCVLVVGNKCSRERRGDLPGEIVRLATRDVGGYVLLSEYTEAIPNIRRVRRGLKGSSSETVLVFRAAAR